MWAGVVETARLVEWPPLPGEVAVQVDAPPVLACPGGVAVRVQVLEDPQPGARLRFGVLEPAGDRNSGALVTVDAADDEDACSSAWRPSLDQMDRPAESRPAENADYRVALRRERGGGTHQREQATGRSQSAFDSLIVARSGTLRG